MGGRRSPLSMAIHPRVSAQPLRRMGVQAGVGGICQPCEVGISNPVSGGMKMGTKTIATGKATRIWPKIQLMIWLGKGFVAGAGLGLAALGVVDIAGTLGIRGIVDFLEREHVFDAFAYGGGVLTVVFQIANLVWKAFTR